MSDPVVITLSGEAPAGLVTEQEYSEREAARPPTSTISVSESPFVSVDTEAQFDSALASGKSIHLRGEGNGGIVDLTRTKQINVRWTIIQGPGHLRFSVPPAAEVRCLWVSATDVTLRDFEMSSTRDPATTIDEGINLPGNFEPHRLRIQRLDMHHWCNAIVKWGGVGTPFTDDVQIEDCRLRILRGHGMVLSNGVRRASVRRCRVVGKLTGEIHPTIDANGFYAYGDTEDLLLEDSIFEGFLGMGVEISTLTPGAVTRRPRVVRCRIADVKRFGVSFGHCIQGYGEHILVDGAGGIGIEVAGDKSTGRVEATTLLACDVRNITEHPTPLTYTCGYTVDGSSDTILQACRVRDISAVRAPNESSGVYVVDSDRAAILNCTFLDAGANAIHLFCGPDSLNTEGHHLVQGCTFRHTKNMETGPGWKQRSVFVSNTNAVVKLNTTYQRPGGNMTYACKTLPGAGVWCDYPYPITGETEFSGSNNIIPVSA